MRKNISQITTQKILVLREDPPNQTVINEDINLQKQFLNIKNDKDSSYRKRKRLKTF